MLKSLIDSINPFSHSGDRKLAALRVRHGGADIKTIPLQERLTAVKDVLGEVPVNGADMILRSNIQRLAGPDVLAALVESGQTTIIAEKSGSFIAGLKTEAKKGNWNQG